MFVLVDGNHGWNSSWSAMHAIFIASGPAFKKSYMSEAFENVNVYPLMCEVLSITCAHSNGSLSNIRHILAVTEDDSMSTMLTSMYLSNAV